MTAGPENRWFLMFPRDQVDGDLASVSGSIYFHMWRTRPEPWTSLAYGDTVYVVDETTRCIQ